LFCKYDLKLVESSYKNLCGLVCDEMKYQEFVLPF
jgi:hypothetical protein